MNNRGQTINVALLLLVIIGLGIAVTYALGEGGTAESSADTVTKNTATRFTIERVAEGAVILRNAGTRPIEEGDVTLVVNGHLMAYEQEEPIEPGSPGALQMPMVSGDCEVRVEAVGGFTVRSTDAKMCVYEEVFETDPQWNNTGVEAEVTDGQLRVRHNGTVGRVFDREDVRNGVWEMEARVKGDSPDLLFMQRNGTGYTASVSPLGGRTELSLWVDDSKKDSHAYDWSWSSDEWHVIKVSADGNGVYFAKLWPDGEREPGEWETFMIDRRYESGGMGVLVDTTGEETTVDYIRLSIPEA